MLHLGKLQVQWTASRWEHPPSKKTLPDKRFRGANERRYPFTMDRNQRRSETPRIVGIERCSIRIPSG